MLAVPVLAGSSAYAAAEAARWRRSLSQKPKKVVGFYAVLSIGMVLGLALNALGYNAIKMLFWSAVLNGLLAPPLIVLVTLLTSDRHVMGHHVNSPTLKILGWLTAAIMSAACVLMFVL